MTAPPTAVAAPPGADPARAALDAQVLAWMREPLPAPGAEDEARFDALARAVFAFQFAQQEQRLEVLQLLGLTGQRGFDAIGHTVLFSFLNRAF